MGGCVVAGRRATPAGWGAAAALLAVALAARRRRRGAAADGERVAAAQVSTQNGDMPGEGS
jgi:MYXO-CTERM domain-containing protein